MAGPAVNRLAAVPLACATVKVKVSLLSLLATLLAFWAPERGRANPATVKDVSTSRSTRVSSATSGSNVALWPVVVSTKG